MRVDSAIIRDLCISLGPMVRCPKNLNGALVLWSLSGNESSFGARITPRHENGYHDGGRWYDANVTYEWGCLAHCSIGPWQVMGANLVRVGYSPLEVLNDVARAAEATLAFLNVEMAHKNPVTLDEIGRMWNTGSISGNAPDYASRLIKNYAFPYPAPGHPR